MHDKRKTIKKRTSSSLLFYFFWTVASDYIRKIGGAWKFVRVAVITHVSVAQGKWKDGSKTKTTESEIMRRIILKRFCKQLEQLSCWCTLEQ